MATAELEVRTGPGREITIENIGPVTHLRIPIPEQGGVVVLKSLNGGGKTTSLKAVEALTAEKGGLDLRDGTVAGRIEGFGATIKVGRSTRRTGELEVVSLEGRLSVADVVDPGFIDPTAADNARIKALVQLTGTKADQSLFYDILENGREDYDRVVKATATDDIIQLSSHVKRCIEAAARTEEHAAENADATGNALREQFAGVDLEAEHNDEVLQAAQTAATLAEDRIKNQATAIADAIGDAEESRAAIEKAESEYQGPSLEVAKVKAANLLTSRTETGLALARAEEAVRLAKEAEKAAKAEHDKAVAVHDAACELCKSAQSHADTISQWRKQVDAASRLKPISQEELSAAKKVLDDAKAAVALGVKVRAALEAKAKHEAARETAKKHRKSAEHFRGAAAAVDGVLSDIVAKAGVPLIVKQGRLICTTKRGETYFGDLSMGERWKMSLDIAIEAVGPHGIITVPQECYEALDPINRRLIAEHVAGKGVVIITAEATSDENLTAEIYDADAH